jgi:hypothetical protein
MATREDLHRRVDALSAAQVARARIVIVGELDDDTSVGAIVARHGEQRLSVEDVGEQFGDLASDGEG